MSQDEFPIEHIQKLDQGKQGVTGLIRSNGTMYVYKISQYMNYLTNHEFLVLTGLNEIINTCPHFCKVISHKRLPIHPRFCLSGQDPFELSETSILLDVLFMEYIPDSIPLYDLISNASIPMTHILSCIKQVMMALVIAQKQKSFVHYDLHACNILMKDCRVDDVYIYVIDSENVFYIPTHGYNPIIIDHGFSYSKDLNGNPSYISLAYTDAGYMSPACDFMADPKVFLISVSEDLQVFRPQRESVKKFRKIVKNIFSPLPVDWKSGWDKTNKKVLPLIDYIFQVILKRNETSPLFIKYPHICLDILQSLIQLPLVAKIKKGSLDDLKVAYRAMVAEFSLIEKECGNTYYSLYIFRRMIDIARPLLPAYTNVLTRSQTIEWFKNELFTVISKIVKYCMLAEVNFERLLCSILSFGQQLEFQLCHMVEVLMKQKAKSYLQMKVQKLEHMYACIDTNFKDTYKINYRTQAHIFDITTNTRSLVDFSNCDESIITALNNLPQYSKGHYIYSLFNDLKE